ERSFSFAATGRRSVRAFRGARNGSSRPSKGATSVPRPHFSKRDRHTWAAWWAARFFVPAVFLGCSTTSANLRFFTPFSHDLRLDFAPHCGYSALRSTSQPQKGNRSRRKHAARINPKVCYRREEAKPAKSCQGSVAGWKDFSK